MPSFFDRISAATNAFLGREEKKADAASPLPAAPVYAPSDLASLPPPYAGAYEGYGMGPLFRPEATLAAYGDSVWLYRSVLSIAMEIASTEFKLRRPRKGGEFEYVESHQALETLKKPQPTADGKSQLTYMDLMLVLGMRLLLNGEDFWVFDKRMSPRLGGSPREIQPALAQFMYVALTPRGEIKEYVYRLPEREVRLPPIDVVHFKIPDPFNYYRGHSPVQAIRYAVDTQKRADVLNAKTLANNAVPSGILKSGQNVGDEQRNKIMDHWRQRYGGPDNAGRVAMLPNGFDFQQIQQSNKDMQYIEGKNLVRDEILANYGVGLEIMGKTESQTRANAEASIFIFQKYGVAPYLKKIADTLTNDYLPAFGGTDGLEFCFDDPVPANMEEKRLNADNLANGGALTPNERRKMFGLEPLDMPGMDTPYLPIGVVPVDLAGLPPEEGPPPGGGDGEEEDPKAGEDEDADDEDTTKESPPKGRAQTDKSADK